MVENTVALRRDRGTAWTKVVYLSRPRSASASGSTPLMLSSGTPDDAQTEGSL